MNEPQDNKLLDPLTERELEILRLLAGGLSDREIGARLFLSTGTVKWHVRNIYSKLGVNKRTAAVVRARALGLLPTDGDNQASRPLPQSLNFPSRSTPFVDRDTDSAKGEAMKRSNRRMSLQSLIVVFFLVIVGGLIVASIFQRSQAPSSTQGGSPAPGIAILPTEAPSQSQIVVDIASSNTKEDWLNAVIEKFNEESHRIASGEAILVRATHVTSGGSQQDILGGRLQPTIWSPGEYSWVETANAVWRDRTGHVLAPADCPQTILAPSGLAMWRPMAEALGWPDTPIGWDDILALASAPEGWASVGHPEWGSFKFGHVHPDYSNVGLLTMTSLAYFASGKTAGLTVNEVNGDAVRDAFRQVELNTYHYGIQSRDLLRLMVTRGPSYLHAVTTSEAETLKTNAEQGDALRFPLVFIFPADGTFWSEHPYCILDGDWVTDEQKEAAAIFRDYLLAPAQQALASENFVRPADETIPLLAPITLENGTDPRVSTATVPRLESPTATVANAVKDVFHNTKKTATVILVLDTSGSMGGDKMANAVDSAQNFINRLDRRDEIYVVGFGTRPYSIGEGGVVSQVGESEISTLGGVYADGNTALYDSVCEATTLINSLKDEDDAAQDPHLYGIVLLSDGEDTASIHSENQMFDDCLPDGESVEGVKVFTIAYGTDANVDLMTRIANRTNGKSFEGSPENIDRIYNAISAEQ